MGGSLRSDDSNVPNEITCSAAFLSAGNAIWIWAVVAQFSLLYRWRAPMLVFDKDISGDSDPVTTEVTFAGVRQAKLNFSPQCLDADMKTLLLILALFTYQGCTGQTLADQANVHGKFSPCSARSRTSLYITGVTASPDANTVVLTWTTNDPSTSTASCGSEQAADNGSPESLACVTNHQAIVAGLSPSTAYNCTVQSGTEAQTIRATTTAYAPSTPITGVSLGTISNSDKCGDTFYNAESNDGTTYVAVDDTTCGLGANGSVNSAMMLAKFTDISSLAGVNVNGLSGYGEQSGGPPGSGLSSKISGVFAMAGDLFLAVGYQNQGDTSVLPQYYGQITESADHGATWINMQGTHRPAGSFTRPYTVSMWPGSTPSNFASPNFVMYGADDGTLGYTVAANRVQNANAYVYVFSTAQISNGVSCWTNCDSFYLARVPRAKLANLSPEDWQFYIGGDGTKDEAWTGVQGAKRANPSPGDWQFYGEGDGTKVEEEARSPSKSNAAPIFTNPGELSYASFEYIPVLNRYLLLAFYFPQTYGTNGNNVVWLAYDSPAPWGPFTLVSSIPNATYGYYNPVLLQADILAAPFTGTTARVLFGGYQRYDLNWATITISH